MAKQQLGENEAFNLRQTLHVAVLDALLRSRRWEPGDLVFQGGTSLHLAHNSPRFSEDLDFLVDDSLRLNKLAESVKDRLTGASWLPKDTQLTVNRIRLDTNPVSFVVTVGADNLIGNVRVKVELWQSKRETLSSLSAKVMQVSARLRMGFGGMAVETYVPTASAPEIYADKVFALAARPYIKPRDVFDLHWLKQLPSHQPTTLAAMQNRLATYPNTSVNTWLAAAKSRRAELACAHELVRTDLTRWLPQGWALDDEGISAFLHSATESLDEGVALIETLHTPTEPTPQPTQAARRKPSDETPSP